MRHLQLKLQYSPQTLAGVSSFFHGSPFTYFLEHSPSSHPCGTLTGIIASWSFSWGRKDKGDLILQPRRDGGWGARTRSKQEHGASVLLFIFNQLALTLKGNLVCKKSTVMLWWPWAHTKTSTEILTLLLLSGFPCMYMLRLASSSQPLMSHVETIKADAFQVRWSTCPIRVWLESSLSVRLGLYHNCVPSSSKIFLTSFSFSSSAPSRLLSLQS